MTTDTDVGDGGPSTFRKVAVPTAVTAVGAAAGVVLTQKPKLREVVSELRDIGVGDLAEDLRDRVESALRKRAAGDGDDEPAASPAPDPAGERNARRAERKERRDRRRRHNAT